MSPSPNPTMQEPSLHVGAVMGPFYVERVAPGWAGLLPRGQITIGWQLLSPRGAVGCSHDDWLAVQDFRRPPGVRAWGRSGFPAGTLTPSEASPRGAPYCPDKGSLPRLREEHPGAAPAPSLRGKSRHQLGMWMKRLLMGFEETMEEN